MRNAAQTTGPTIVTIFGATGDLASRKIFPALWHLYERDRCPEGMQVIGIARRTLSHDDFRRLVADAVCAHDASVGEEKLSQFLSRFSYHQGDLNDRRTYGVLKEIVAAHEQQAGMCAHKLMYMAIAPTLYAPVFDGLASVALNVSCPSAAPAAQAGDTPSGWVRILIEKPFGNDAENAKHLDELLTRYFREEQIYRIDHYFFKEIVQGIENFRFSNNLFEQQWGSELVESVMLRLNETLDVSGRGAFYDAVGALRDVGQNHLLAMLSLLAADYTPRTSAYHVRASRAALLQTLVPWRQEALQKNTTRAQYEGYRAVKGVAPHSDTETYFALETELTHPRWRGVPIRMEAGKALGEARKEIVLTLKHASPCLLCEVGPHAPNKIIFRLEPRDEIVIHFWTKKPGFDKELEERTFSFFLYEKENKTQYVEEYATLLYDAMRGDHSLFVSGEEVQAAWTFIDPIVHAWESGLVPLTQYPRGEMPRPLFQGYSEIGGGDRHAHPTRATGIESSSGDAPANVVSGVRSNGARGVLGIVGLGKMGSNVARRLAARGWRVTGYNKSPEVTHALAQGGVITPASSLKELMVVLPTPRTVWLMVPHAAVDAVLEELVPLLEEGDTVIDGGNSFFKDSQRRADILKGKRVHFLDVGVSGGPQGALEGASLMIGGTRAAFDAHEPLFRDVATPNGYQFFEGAGVGHFVKMVHNGIEYGMMQSLAEGFAVLKARFPSLDLGKVADVYNHRSVIESRLVGWLKRAFAQYGTDLEAVSGSVAQTGEGAWTVQTAKELNVPTPAIEEALTFRIASADKPSYIGQILSALRSEFGGHDISRNKHL